MANALRRYALLLALSPLACAGTEPLAETSACAALEDVRSVGDVPRPRTCPTPPPAPDLRHAARLAVSVYHFNIQYVAGGGREWSGLGPEWDERGIEDLIVRQGLEPVLDLYLAHPTFRTDI